MVRRRGLTKVEVLVGVAIVALIGGLLLSGMCRIGESANRIKCQNNLKQLGLAVHNYHDTCDRLPPLTDQGEGAPRGQGLPSVFALLTNFLESDPWNYTDRRTPTEYHSHSSVTFTFEAKGDTFTEHGGIANQTYRRVFLCPKDDTAHDLRDVPITLPDGTTGYYAAGSYAANGLVPWGSGTIPKSFPRGLGDTILMAERPQVCRTASGEEVQNLWGVGFYSPQMPAFACLTPAEPPGLASTGKVAPVVPLPAEDGPVMVRIGRKDAEPVPPDFPNPLQRVRDGRCDPRLPGGPHPAGMQVLMADGSVRSIAWDTSPWVFWSACVP
jgi:prepilin-type processing-associated H-X9-DG protein